MAKEDPREATRRKSKAAKANVLPRGKDNLWLNDCRTGGNFKRDVDRSKKSERGGKVQKGSGKKITTKELREETKNKTKKFGKKPFGKKKGEFKKKGGKKFDKKNLNKEDLDADMDKWWSKKDPEMRQKLLDDELDNYMQKTEELGQ